MSDQQAASIMAEGLQKQLGGTPLLRDLSLTIAEGEIFGLFGPSGSGKSTSSSRMIKRLANLSRVGRPGAVLA